MIKLSFGSMTLMLNAFNVCRQPNIDTDELHDINNIDEIHEVDIIALCITDPLELALIRIMVSLNDSILKILLIS